MERCKTGRKTVLLSAVWLLAVATAAFYSMNAFTRPVFGRIHTWQLCFFVLAVNLILSAAVKKPAVCLAGSAAAAAGMYFLTPFYGAVFFPVALQAALWEAAQTDTKTGRAVYALSLLCVPASIPLRLRLREYLTFNAQSYGNSEPVGEAYACLAGLVLLLALWTVLLIRSLRPGRPKKKTSAKKGGRSKKKEPADHRLPAVYAVCMLHTVLAGISCTQLFTGEYVKLLFFANGLFVFYLLFRRDQLFCGALRLPAPERAEQNKQRG